MILSKIKSEKDNLELEVCIIEPKGTPKAIIQISHGMSEHKERYYDFMNYLAENGYICVIHDHRGHGASVINKSDLGYFYTENIDYIVNDLYQITKYINVILIAIIKLIAHIKIEKSNVRKLVSAKFPNKYLVKSQFVVSKYFENFILLVT